jgi:CheY-like chemotaxis protein
MERVLALVGRAVRRPAVLVVDDVAEQAAHLADGFRVLGLAAEARSSGASAVRLVEEGAVDVCVLDLVMPEMDGLATLQQIHEVDPSIGAIALSGEPVPEMMHSFMALGGQACLRKPVAAHDLMRAVARARGLEREGHAGARERVR